jgi:hypothetical protein
VLSSRSNNIQLDEKKVHLFLDFIDDDVGLQRKKTRLCEHSEVDECLYEWP